MCIVLGIPLFHQPVGVDVCRKPAAAHTEHALHSLELNIPSSSSDVLQTLPSCMMDLVMRESTDYRGNKGKSEEKVTKGEMHQWGSERKRDVHDGDRRTDRVTSHARTTSSESC